MEALDALDRPGTVVDSLSGTLSYTYDGLDSPLSESDSATGATVSYGYDSNGRRTALTTQTSQSFSTTTYGYDCADELVAMSTNIGVEAPSCSPSSSVANGSTSTQVGFYYDPDGMPQWTQVDGILTSFTRDADERVTSQSYSAPTSQYAYGNLTYSYDPDGNLVDKGGSLAAVSLPPNDSAQYDKNDQLTQWNAITGQTDAADNITQDPASGLMFQWSARNQVLGFHCCPPGYSIDGPALTESYDASGRRETSSVNGGDSLTFVHDGSAVSGWLDSFNGDLWSFLQVSGATLAGAYTTSAGTTTWVPLLDASGSTIAIVNAASPASPPATTYTYNPSGVPSVSGQASNYPFLYQGMENEFTDQQADFGEGILYYRGAGQFYSAQIARSFSLTGAQGTSGPGGAGGYSPAGRSLPPMFTPAGHESYWQWVESEDTSALEGTVSISSGEGSGGVPVGGIIYGIESLISFFEWAFGGSAGLPPNYFVYKARLERAKRHPLYDQIDGIPTDIVLNESPAAPKFCGDPHPCRKAPLQKAAMAPEYRKAPPTPKQYSGVGAFFLCGATFTFFIPELPVGCVTTAAGCGAGALPACAGTAALCTSYAGGLALCYGAAFPNSHFGPPARDLIPPSAP